jgi:hypothetical protein
VLDLDVYMDVLYIMCAMCRFYNSNCTGYIIFYKFFIAQPYLLRLKRP